MEARPDPRPDLRLESRHAGRAVPPRAKPDPTSVRLAFGIGGIAAASALVTAIVRPGAPASPVVAFPATEPATITQQRPVTYVQLAPGQSAPPGAKVIDAKAPKPITIVTQVPAPAQKTVVIRTTQSGRVIP